MAGSLLMREAKTCMLCYVMLCHVMLCYVMLRLLMLRGDTYLSTATVVCVCITI